MAHCVTESVISFVRNVMPGHACAAPLPRPHLLPTSPPGWHLSRAGLRLPVHGPRSTHRPEQPAHRTLPDCRTSARRRDCVQTNSGHGLQVVQPHCVQCSAKDVVTSVWAAWPGGRPATGRAHQHPEVEPCRLSRCTGVMLSRQHMFGLEVRGISVPGSKASL